METTNTLLASLSKAQAEMRNPTFDKVNPHFKSKFASLAAVRDAVIPVLAKHGIAFTQTYQIADGGVQVLVTAIHKDDKSLSSVVPLPGYSNSQQWASATTYIRRVSLMAIAGVCGDDDDDGERAMPERSGIEGKPRVSAIKVGPSAIPDDVKTALKEAAGEGAHALTAVFNSLPHETQAELKASHAKFLADLKSVASHAKVASNG